MKKLFAVIAVVAVLGIGTVASAHMFGGGYGGGGYGYGPMMGWGPGYGYDKENAKFLDETAETRAKIHEKRFEYFEALRAGDEKKAETLAEELDKLTDEVYTKAPRRGYGKGFARGYGRGGGYCW